MKPTLVLNGDILEMALTDTNKAAMVFDRFIALALNSSTGNWGPVRVSHWT